MGANYNPKSLEAIKPYCFQKGESGNPKGRPKSRVDGYVRKLLSKRKAAKKYAMNLKEVNEWEAKLLVFTLDELKLVAQDTEAPAYAKSLAVALINDMKNGICRTATQLRERQYGSAKQTIEVTGADGMPLVEQQQLTAKEAQNFIKDLMASI